MAPDNSSGAISLETSKILCRAAETLGEEIRTLPDTDAQVMLKTEGRTRSQHDASIFRQAIGEFG